MKKNNAENPMVFNKNIPYNFNLPQNDSEIYKLK